MVTQRRLLRMDQEASHRNDIDSLLAKLKEESRKLSEREQDIHEQAEELASQKEELTAAIEELMAKNRSLEETLNQLRERNYELDQILYRTSHDLRSPLSSIKGILALLQLEPQSDVIRNYGKHIENQANEMDSLLRSLASLSKSILEDPKLDVIDLSRLIWQVVNEYRHLPGWKHVEVSVDVHDTNFFSDVGLITIIFQSLFSNAFIFRDPGKTGRLIIRTREQNDNWMAEIIDDGEGIETSIGPHIFDMFYRGSERSIGSGLGLYVAKKAVERLKGNISFHHEAGATCFTISVPLRIADRV
jgi:signal transduction histidine kinase